VSPEAVALRRVDLAGALATFALLAMVAAGTGGLARILLALVFVTFLPGWALLGHWQVVSELSRVAMAVAASLAASVIVALAMAWLRSWHPLFVFYILGVVTLLALGWRAARPPRQGHRHSRPPDAAAPGGK
jgi:uncharacterized membrane protein